MSLAVLASQGRWSSGLPGLEGPLLSHPLLLGSKKSQYRQHCPGQCVYDWGIHVPVRDQRDTVLLHISYRL